MARFRRWSSARVLFGLIVLLSGLHAAPDPPDLEINAATGHVESVDLASTPTDRVRHVDDTGQGGTRTVSIVSSHAAGAPRIAITAGGDTWVVWWKDSTADEIYYAVRDLDTLDWGAERRISTPGEVSRYPEIVHGGSTAWIAYEIADGADTEIAVLSITDSPEPISSRTVLESTGFSGDVDVLVHAESNHAWVTWVDSATDVGWAEYDAATELWGLPQLESYSGSDVAGARESIRTTVVGP